MSRFLLVVALCALASLASAEPPKGEVHEDEKAHHSREELKEAVHKLKETVHRGFEKVETRLEHARETAVLRAQKRKERAAAIASDIKTLVDNSNHGLAAAKERAARAAERAHKLREHVAKLSEHVTEETR